MFPAKFTTLLTVEEDARDPECLATRFSLIKSVSGRALFVGWPIEGWVRHGAKVLLRPLF